MDGKYELLKSDEISARQEIHYGVIRGGQKCISMKY